MSLKTDWYNRPFEDYFNNQYGGFGRNVPEGAEVGIEIEVEGRNLPRNGITGWTVVEDHSLRGESAEYVFRAPEPRTRVPTRLATLSGHLAREGVEVNQSYRTSVHVHMNVRGWQIKKIYNNIMLYIIFEDILGEMAGKDRIGNLFCLRAKDAEFFLDQLRQSIITDNIGLMNSQNLRYSAVNPLALFVHGSLEFRAFRGTTDTALIQEWVDTLFAIRDAAQRFDNPIQIVEQMSSMGARDFARSIFTDEQISRWTGNWEEHIYEGIGLIQHAAYGHGWVVTDINRKIRAKSQDTMAFTQAMRILRDPDGLRPGQWVQPAPPEPAVLHIDEIDFDDMAQDEEDL